MASRPTQGLSVRDVLARSGKPLTFAEIQEMVGAKEEHVIRSQLTRLRRAYQVAVLGVFEAEAIPRQERKYLWIVPLMPESIPVSQILQRAKKALTEDEIIERAGAKHLGVLRAEITRLRQTGQAEMHEKIVGKKSVFVYTWNHEES